MDLSWDTPIKGHPERPGLAKPKSATPTPARQTKGATTAGKNPRKPRQRPASKARGVKTKGKNTARASRSTAAANRRAERTVAYPSDDAGAINLPINHTMTLAAPKVLKVGSTCSGTGTMEFALEALGQQFNSQFACDSNRAAMTFYQAHHNSKFFLTDALDETHDHAPYVDLYSAGWPCQPFSAQGNLRGMGDVRSQPIHPILNYIQKKQPRAIFLENVPNIVTKFRDTFDWVVNELKGMVGDGGDALYHIRWKVLRTDWYGIPQTRARVYIIGIMSNSLHKFAQTA